MLRISISKSIFNFFFKFRYQLRVFIYKARNLPPADSHGTSDPFFEVNCAGQKGKTTVKENTLNPGFFETITLDVDLPNMEKVVCFSSFF